MHEIQASELFEVPIFYVFTDDFLKKNNSTIANIGKVKKQSIPIEEVISKSQDFLSEKLIYETSPKFAKNMKEPNRIAIIDTEDISLFDIDLVFDHSSKLVYWKVKYIVTEPLGGQSFFNVVMTLNGQIAPRKIKTKVKKKSKRLE